jgi:hypothetical protein
MSKLRRADYSEHLVGKTIKRVHWNNDEEKRCLTLEFTDQTFCSFRFSIMSYAALSTRKLRQPRVW